MRANAYNNYLENEVLTADPLKLVLLLYRGALDAIAAARRHLACGDIRSRSLAITKAVEILSELNRTLDHGTGSDIARELARLYDFAINALLQANSQQIDQPLAEAEAVLATLLEGWQNCQEQEESRYAELSCA